jgi:hypothetical protein
MLHGRADLETSRKADDITVRRSSWAAPDNR